MSIHVRILKSMFLFSAFVASAAAAADVDLVAGSYTSITESECNVSIELSRDFSGVAVYSCRLEDGSGKDMIGSVPLTWKLYSATIEVISGKSVDTVQYVDTFQYLESTPLEFFGLRDRAPAIKLLTPNPSQSPFGAYGGVFWKRPLQ